MKNDKKNIEEAKQKYNEVLEAVRSGKWLEEHRKQIDEALELYEKAKEELKQI